MAMMRLRRLRHYQPSRYILGIETSCDDTAAAVLDENGRILSHVVSSQWDILHLWKGVVPNLAARAHGQNLPKVVSRAIQESGLSSADQLDAVAVTAGPGLAMCLDQGVSFARDLAKKHQLGLIPVHHLEGHVLSPFLTEKDLQFPYLVLLVSGGHCMLVLAKTFGQYEVLGETIDDSVGEAFDKVARLLGLLDNEEKIHPGRALELLASEGNPEAIKLTEPMLHQRNCDFSFSGIKSAVRRQVEGQHDAVPADIAASFQHVATMHLVRRTKRAIQLCSERQGLSIKHVAVCGGVAANQYIRHHIQRVVKEADLVPVFPSLEYCTDNGAMIGYVGALKMKEGMLFDVDNEMIDFRARWPIDRAHELPTRVPGISRRD